MQNTTMNTKHTTTKHTPGPWKQVGGTEVWEERNVYRICKCSGSYGPKADAMRFNARLITAAPELLAACQAIVATWERGDLAAAARQCQAAIDKAKGRP